MSLEATSLVELVQRALGQYWGFESLRPLQAEVVDAAMAGRDAVVVMPTGGGKSLCFQLPAVASGRLTVVVSPLIALMKDQVDALRIVGVEAEALNSSMKAEEERDVAQRVRRGEVRLLYLSPERLLLPSTLRMLAEADGGQGVARFAVDEAHCISGWGHDFRPEYRRLGEIKQTFPDVPMQAFTATATPKVQKDIAIQLQLRRPRLFVGRFDRPNLTYRVVAKDDAVGRTVEAVRRYPEEGVIIYCLSRDDTERLASALQAQGISAVAYHAGLSTEVRSRASEEFAQERVHVVVATVAFGMGIDRSNVRCVIHECLPKSLEGYQQETGRAGRDGLPGECVLLYSHGDVVRLKRLLTGEHHLALLEEVRRFATSHRCRHQALSEHFGQAYEVAEGGCGACDVCLGGTVRVENGTAVAHQVLAVALEMGKLPRSFGVAALVGVLAGSHSKQIRERGFTDLAGFGALRAERQERVRFWIHQLADLELLAVSAGEYPVVTVTERGRAVFEAGEEVTLIENSALIGKGKAPSHAGSELRSLFETLRAWRREVAAARNVPAYVVLHDAVLMKISDTLPGNFEELQRISGIGEKRAREFGEAILQHVAAFKPSRPEPKPHASDALFAEGWTVERVAEQLDLRPSTVWGYLSDWVERAQPDTVAPWISETEVRQVEAAIQEVGAERLRPIFEFLDGAVGYDSIRVARAYLSTKPNPDIDGLARGDL